MKPPTCITRTATTNYSDTVSTDKSRRTTLPLGCLILFAFQFDGFPFGLHWTKMYSKMYFLRSHLSTTPSEWWLWIHSFDRWDATRNAKRFKFFDLIMCIAYELWFHCIFCWYAFRSDYFAARWCSPHNQQQQIENWQLWIGLRHICVFVECFGHLGAKSLETNAQCTVLSSSSSSHIKPNETSIIMSEMGEKNVETEKREKKRLRKSVNRYNFLHTILCACVC